MRRCDTPSVGSRAEWRSNSVTTLIKSFLCAGGKFTRQAYTLVYWHLTLLVISLSGSLKTAMQFSKVGKWLMSCMENELLRQLSAVIAYNEPYHIWPDQIRRWCYLAVHREKSSKTARDFEINLIARCLSRQICIVKVSFRYCGSHCFSVIWISSQLVIITSR